MKVEKKIEELGIELPEMSPPGAMYILSSSSVMRCLSPVRCRL